jgi:hypothetical protein
VGVHGQRGRQLADRGAVQFEAFGPVRVTASVEDDRVHRVEFGVTSDELYWSCTCSAETFARMPRQRRSRHGDARPNADAETPDYLDW